MDTPAQQIEIFRHYAEEELKNHTQELQTHYQNRQLASEDLKQEAFEKHRGIYNKELSDKIGELITENNNFLIPALNDLKEAFVKKLNLSNELSFL